VSRRLGHLVELVTTAPGDDPRPFVALENIGSRTGSLLPDTELPRRTPEPTGMTAFQQGDVLFGKLRPYLAKSWRADRDGVCSTELIVMRPQPSVDGRWLAYLAQSDLLVEWAVATSEGVKMPRTSWEKLRLLKVDPPQRAEQRVLADYLERETRRIGYRARPPASNHRASGRGDQRRAERGVRLSSNATDQAEAPSCTVAVLRRSCT
jgi:type I restriction enzyme, S subunit